MATLHRFKLLATQCTTAAGRVSPGTSPSASPCTQYRHAASPAMGTPSKSPSFNIRHHHRRRRTLRRLLSGSSSSSSSSNSSTSNTRSIFTRVSKGRSSSASSMDVQTAVAPEKDGGERRGLLSHRSLKDLFVSSPSPPPSFSSSSARAGCQNVWGGGGVAGETDDSGAIVGDWRRIRSPIRGRGGWRLGLETGLSSSSRRFGGSGISLRYRLLRRAWRPVLVTIPE